MSKTQSLPHQKLPSGRGESTAGDGAISTKSGEGSRKDAVCTGPNWAGSTCASKSGNHAHTAPRNSAFRKSP